MKINHSHTELQDKLNKLKRERSEFLESQNLIIKNLISSKEIDTDQNKIIEDLKEIDREVEGLSHVITNSVSLAISIIEPIRERERAILNIMGTMEILEIENKIKDLLVKLKNEKSKNHQIENKINIILQANNFIKINHTVFDNYRESFLKESQDVLSYLQNTFTEQKNKLFQILEQNGNVKDCNSIITEMDKNKILSYKLTNDSNTMDTFFEMLAQFVIKLICKNKIKELSSQLSGGNGSIPINYKESVSLIASFILKIFLKISSLINEKKNYYFKEFSDYKILSLLIIKLLTGIEESIVTLITIISETSDKLLKDPNADLDFICREKINIISNFEKFKFFICILQEKIALSVQNESDFNSSLIFFKKYNSLIYDLGERYANCEIKFMKNKLFVLFREESKNFHTVLDKNLNSKFDELVPITLNAIDDFFYILKISGSRAIDSLNLQLSLAIINNIKGILSEDLLELLDHKISTLFMENRNSNLNDSGIRYLSKDEPVLSSKPNFANLFLISSINAIDQSKSNISDLMDEFRHSINEIILNSDIFDHTKIILGNPDEEKINKNITYFKKNEIELINITFSDVEMIVNKYEEFLNKKFKLSFEFFLPIIKSSTDILNSINYYIEGKNILTAEMTDSFSSKFIEETEKYLKQWKLQFSESAFNKFLSFYAERASNYIETSLMNKKYSSYGVIILEKVKLKINFRTLIK